VCAECVYLNKSLKLPLLIALILVVSPFHNE
jgi:hypothetical protein